MTTPPTPPARMRTADKLELAAKVRLVLKEQRHDIELLRAFYLVDMFEELGIITAPAEEVAR